MILPVGREQKDRVEKGKTASQTSWARPGSNTSPGAPQLIRVMKTAERRYEMETSYISRHVEFSRSLQNKRWAKRHLREPRYLRFSSEIWAARAPAAVFTRRIICTLEFKSLLTRLKSPLNREHGVGRLLWWVQHTEALKRTSTNQHVCFLHYFTA